MTPLLTISDLAAHWKVSKRQATRIASRLGIKPLPLSPNVPRFSPRDVAKAERQLSLSN